MVVHSVRFSDRVCLVTGGGRGIGRATALALAAEGAAVGILARTADQCEEVVAEIGDRAVVLTADVTDHDACGHAVTKLSNTFGPPSAIVNAAGISPVRAPAELHDPVAFRRILDVNAFGAYNVSRAASSALLARGGAIVNVASVLGLIASPRLVGYGASKAAMIQLTRTLAREWASRSVRVNAVCPGYVVTEMTADMLARDHIRDAVLSDTPIGRLAKVEEVVAPILFLLSDEASYITGAALPVDGGLAA